MADNNTTTTQDDSTTTVTTTGTTTNTTVSTDTSDNKFKIMTNGQIPDNVKPALPSQKERANYADRRSENSSVSSNGGSIATRDDGSIEISANNNTHLLLSRTGTIQETAAKKMTTANRVDIVADEININHHILNNKLYDLTDFKQVTTGDFQNGIVGNFTVLGTVLTKSWEPDLKRYVFIRRLARIPMFSPEIKPPDVKTGMGLTDITKATVDLVGVMNKASADGKDASGQAAAAQSALDDSAVEKYKKNGQAPNGMYYEDNDINYLVKELKKQNSKLSDEDAKKQAIQTLSTDPKYTTDLTAPNGQKYKQNDIDYLLKQKYSITNAISALSQTDKYKKKDDSSSSTSASTSTSSQSS
jgi:hypothetical protein